VCVLVGGGIGVGGLRSKTTSSTAWEMVVVWLLLAWRMPNSVSASSDGSQAAPLAGLTSSKRPNPVTLVPGSKLNSGARSMPLGVLQPPVRMKRPAGVVIDSTSRAATMDLTPRIGPVTPRDAGGCWKQKVWRAPESVELT